MSGLSRRARVAIFVAAVAFLGLLALLAVFSVGAAPASPSASGPVYTGQPTTAPSEGDVTAGGPEADVEREDLAFYVVTSSGAAGSGASLEAAISTLGGKLRGDAPQQMRDIAGRSAAYMADAGAAQRVIEVRTQVNVADAGANANAAHMRVYTSILQAASDTAPLEQAGVQTWDVLMEKTNGYWTVVSVSMAE